MSDDQIIAVYRALSGPPKGQPFSKTADECRALLLERFPNHANVDAIFQTGALTTQFRADAYKEFDIEEQP